jgi:hypothetical protein
MTKGLMKVSANVNWKKIIDFMNRQTPATLVNAGNPLKKGG